METTWFVVGYWLFVLAALVTFFIWVQTRVIHEYESGLVIKRFGKPMPKGRLIALNGEAGFQARLLMPGWHFGLWRWQFKIERVPLMTIRPSEIALVMANDGEGISPERVLGKEVECDHFQDAEAFLRQGGERGRQIAVLTAGTYRINPALFDVVTASRAQQFGLSAGDLRVYEVPAGRLGIVTALDGRPISKGDLAGGVVKGHESFQRGQAFIEAGGCRGLQEEVLLSGSWNLNPWFVQVEQVPLYEIPIGHVGVVVSYVGKEHVDVSGEEFKHGDLVERGRKGVWIDPLLPGKHAINTRIMKVELVPTTNIVLNWATRTESHKYDEKLSPIQVRSKDGFSFSLDVSQIIHIGMKTAPRVISRVGSMQNLVDHVLQPTVANYFRNSAQEVTVLEFLSARSERQQKAYDAIFAALEMYDVECIDTLIGDIVPPADLMKTQTDRKIADELRRTFEVQRQAQVQRQELERETAIANMQAEVVRSEQMVRISERNALSVAEAAKGDAAALRVKAEANAMALEMQSEAEANATRKKGLAQADADRAVGTASADVFRLGKEALGEQGFIATQLATILGEHGVKLVPDIAVSGQRGEGGGLAEVLISKMLAGTATIGPKVTNGAVVAKQ